MPNPLVLAAVQFFQSIALVDDFIPATQNNWQRCVLASSLGARLGMDIDAVKTEIEGFDPESHIPPGKQNEVFKILNQFLKGVKAQPSWFAQWKEKKAETAKAKQAAGKDGEDQTTKGDDQADGEQTGAAAVADAANGQEGADQSQAAEPAVAGQDGEFKIGDIVMGVAIKAKDKWAQKCEIVEILTKHYKVKMLTGMAEGELHKFVKSCIKAIPPEAVATVAPRAAESSEAAVADAPKKNDSDSDMKSVEHMFD